ncbi:MAG: hypothetical protein ABIW76_14355, partial [Fibrobacteria bacterium]
FPVGTVLLAGAMAVVDPRLGGAFLALGGAAGAGVWLVLRKVRMDPGEYDRVMAVKYAASGLFSVFLGITLWMQSAGWIQGK